MKFTFKAINSDGETYTGTTEAPDRYTLAQEFKQKGETLVSAEANDKHKGGSLLERINAALSRVTLREKVVFARNLSAMLTAGLPLSRGLSVAARQTRNPKFKKVLADLNDEIRKGQTFANALEHQPKIFSSIFVAMVRAGEESGKLADALGVLGKQMEESYQLRKRVKGAMTYPSVVISAMIIVGILMLMFVVPTLTETFVELQVDLPASTRFIIGISDALKNNTVISLGAIVGFIALVGMALRTQRGKRIFEFLILHFPVIKNIAKEKNAAQTARTLSSLLSAGVDVVSALTITKDVLANSYYKEVLAEAAVKVEKGAPISDSFFAHEDVYPILVAEMISVGEEVGDVSKMLERIADFYEGEVNQKTKDLSTIIEPLLMVVIGSVVGFFAVSMVSPIYSLSSAI